MYESMPKISNIVLSINNSKYIIDNRGLKRTCWIVVPTFVWSDEHINQIISRRARMGCIPKTATPVPRLESTTCMMRSERFSRILYQIK